MTSKTIEIHSAGDGFRDAHLETKKMTAGLPEEQALEVELVTEEILSLFNSVTGDISSAEYWIENEDNCFTFHLSVRQKLGNVQRGELIQSSSSGRNEAAKGFLGTLREIIVQAMSVGRDIDQFYSSESYSSPAADLSDAVISSPRWDQFERSVLLSLVDNVTVRIRGDVVKLTATKKI
jgi:hypothetical protein